MSLFGYLYARTMHWSRHRLAPWYLGLLSFADSSFSPVPPDVMLAPMAMARPKRAMLLALITTLTSVAGGVLGYFIGYFAFQAVAPWMAEAGYMGAFETARAWFETWGFWAVLLAGFSPVPYKVFTIAGGAMVMNLPGFILASLVGRGARFFLVAGLMAWGGERMERFLMTWADRLGWLAVAIAVVVYWFMR